MATHRHIFVSFSVVIFLLLTPPSSPLSTVAEEDEGGGTEWEDESGASYIENELITWKYGLMWKKVSLKDPRYDFSNFNDDIESVNCTSDVNCTAALPGVELALEYDSDRPSSPYCNYNTSDATSGYVAKCTCGKDEAGNDLCVSYSRESTTGNPFYYCGPCGDVGSKCTYRCTHELAECRGGYCECINEGTFYDMSYCTVAEEDEGGGTEWEDESGASYIENELITWKYGLMWKKVSLKDPRYDFSNFNDDIESVNCTSDVNCTAALPGVELALEYDSDRPSSPYCNYNTSDATSGYVAKCTCGKDEAGNDLCVSYSRESTTGNPFYYCGPCGDVGSKCTYRCTHELAECRGGYCECINEGTFYDMSYCYIPFYGQELLINLLIATSILLLCCATLAYGYHKLGNRHLRRGSFYNERGNSPGRRESPADDTPPAYDDVMEKLPSYQDAIQMVEKSDAERGLSNPAFEEDESSLQRPKTNQESTITDAAILQCDAEGENNDVFEQENVSPPRCHDTTKSVASSPYNNAVSSTTQAPNEDIASFPESSAREDSVSELSVMNEQQGLRTQPIELLLYDALHTQHSTVSP